MKKFWMMILVFGLLSLNMAVFAEPATAENDDDLEMVGPGERGEGRQKGLNKGEKISADKVIERLRSSKEKIIGRISERLAKFPERLEAMESRVDRIAKRRDNGASKGVASDTAQRSAQAKELINKRYENFKERISKRKEMFEQRAVQRRAKFEQRIAGMNDTDKAKVMAEFEATQKEIAAEIARVSDEVQKKLESTFQKILSKID